MTEGSTGDKGTAIIVGRNTNQAGAVPQLTKRALMNYYFNNNKVKTVADIVKWQIKARRYYFNSKNENAVKILKKFDRESKLAKVIDSWVLEGVVTGDAFTEMLSPINLRKFLRVPVSTIVDIDRNSDGSYKSIIQMVDGKRTPLEPERFIHFKLIDVDGLDFGVGIIHALATPQIIDGEVRPSVLANYAKMRDSMVRTMDRHASPFMTAFYEGASDDFIKTEADKIRNAKPSEIYVTNKKNEFKEISIDPRARFEGYVNFMLNDVDSGLMHPVIRLLTQPSALADAQAAAEIMEPFLFGIEDAVKEKIDEEIIPRVLKSNGLAADTEITFEWGSQDSADLEMSDLWEAVRNKTVDRAEARDILRKQYHWPLKPGNDEPEEEEEPADDKKEEPEDDTSES